MRILQGTVLLALAAALTACAVGPHYHRPAFDTTAAYKERDGWKPSEPTDTLDRGPWWEIFDDDAAQRS